MEHLLGDSPVIRRLREHILKAAPGKAPVLVHGEIGAGRDLVAQALHHYSTRNGQPFVTINCAALPLVPAEAELFGSEGSLQGTGHRPGLVEAARGGTLYLDEVSDLPLHSQALLLRLADTGEIRRIGGSLKPRHVDVRLICSTRHNLHALSHSGDFRDDFLYRIDVVRLAVPPLRERIEDIPIIVASVLARICKRYGIKSSGFSAASMQALSRHDWPGNVRELENVVERAVVLATENDPIEPEILGLETDRSQENAKRPVLQAAPLPSTEDSERVHPVGEGLSLEEYFQHFVLTHQDSMSETDLARKLGISRKCLWERRQRFGIARTAGRRDAAAAKGTVL